MLVNFNSDKVYYTSKYKLISYGCGRLRTGILLMSFEVSPLTDEFRFVSYTSKYKLISYGCGRLRTGKYSWCRLKSTHCWIKSSPKTSPANRKS